MIYTVCGIFSGIPNLDEVLESVEEIVDWMKLGLKLGILHPTLKKIDQEERGCIERCKREMLAAWLRGDDNAREQTWSTLVDSLKKMDKISLAKEMERVKVMAPSY